MSRLHLLFLWALTITAGVIYFETDEDPQDFDQKTKLEIGSSLLPGDFVETITGFRIDNGEKSVTVKKADGEWVVEEQSGFPANLSTVSRAVRSLREAKISQGVVATSEYYDRFDLAPQTEDKNEKPESITFLTEDGEGPTLFLGKLRKSSGGAQSSAGRFVRMSDDDSGVYVISESFSFLNYDSDTWIEKLLSPLEEKPISFEVSAPNDESFKGWKASRKTAVDDFLLADLGEKEETRSSETALLKSAFTRSPFLELISAEDYEKRADKKGIRTVKATDTSGSTFLINITPEKQKEKKDDKEDPSAPIPAINYLVSIEVLNGPVQPAPPGEDATLQEKAVFQERIANFRDLALASKRMGRVYGGRYFLVNTSVVSPFLKNRGELVKEKEEKKDPVSVTTDPIQVPNPDGVPTIPGNKTNTPPASIARPPKRSSIEAVTPPIRVPPLPNKPKEGQNNEPPKEGDKPEDPKQEEGGTND